MVIDLSRAGVEIGGGEPAALERPSIRSHKEAQVDKHDLAMIFLVPFLLLLGLGAGAVAVLLLAKLACVVLPL